MVEVKTYIKLILRGIRSSLNRFCAILGIVALGAGFLAGLLATTPDMQHTLNEYFNENSVYDINIKSTLGLTSDDAQALESIEKIAKVCSAYTFDAVVSNQNEKSYTARFFGKLDEMNRYTLLSGREPEKPGECIAVSPNGYSDIHNIGDVYTVSNNSEDSPFTSDTFTVVGIARSPLFVSIEAEASTVGTGSIELALFVTQDSFSDEYFNGIYTDIYVSAKTDLDIFSDDYKAFIEELEKSVTEIGKKQSDLRYNEIVDDATAELEEGRKEYSDAKAEADKELSDALQTITDSEKHLEEAWAELHASEQALLDNKEALAGSKAAYEDGLAQLNDQKTELEKIREDAEAAKALQASGVQLPAEAVELIRIYDEGTAAVLEAENKLNETKIQLDSGEKALKEAEALLADGKNELESNEKLLDESKIKYEAEKKKAEEELAKALEQLNDAENEISKIEHPEWLIFTIQDNVGFSSYDQNVQKVAAISKVFPVFFFLVAALVALTTMTRMVEEQRSQSGLLKALGYSNTAVLSYYVIYGGLASLLGCALGLLPGFIIFPKLISNAYGMMYSLPPTSTPFNWTIALTIAPIIVIGIMLTSFIACRSELRKMPAYLLQPSAPKPGKRILLERIKPLWKRLSFIHKVTVRNLFRYKKRFFMTVIGIAGCTALLVTGFGIKDSISDIVEKQFSEIDHYDIIIQLSDSASDTEGQYPSVINDKSIIDSFLGMYSENAEIASQNKNSLTVYVPEHTDELDNFISLRNRKSGEKLEFNESAVILTEKLAGELGLKAGDSFTLNLNGESADLILTGISENYIASYLYIGREKFEETFNTVPEFKQILANFSNEAEANVDTARSEILKSDQVMGLRSLSSVRESFANSLSSIDYIIAVLIVAAGALAIIVLYNLTNINICERKKELATIKVLGFYDYEVSSYVFREINILSLTGTGLGLLLGVWLHKFVIETVEVDAVMFGRNIYLLSFVLAALITFGFTLIVNLIMRKTIKKIDMVESMKAND